MIIWVIDDLKSKTVFPAEALWHSVVIAQLKINTEGKLQKNYFKAVPEKSILNALCTI